MGQYV